MQDTVDSAAAPPRTLAQIIEDARRAVCSLYRFKRKPEADIHILAGERHRGAVTGAPGKLGQPRRQRRFRLGGRLGERLRRSASVAQRPHVRVTFAADRDSSPDFRCPCGPGFMPASRGPASSCLLGGSWMVWQAWEAPLLGSARDRGRDLIIDKVS